MILLILIVAILLLSQPSPGLAHSAAARPFAGRSAVVVGSGPAGLASALVLSRRHGMDVTLVESDRGGVEAAPSPALTADGAGGGDASGGGVAAFNVGKAFLYLIDGRGQSFTSGFPRVNAGLAEKGVAMSEFMMQTVPADQDEALADPKSLPVSLAGKTPAYWIPRNEFVGILADEVLRGAEADDQGEGDGWGSITILGATDCTDVALPERGGEDGKAIRITAAAAAADSSSASRTVLEADLVVGADGLRSSVRTALARKSPKRFTMRERPSLAAGLRYKVLQLPARFPVPLGGGESNASTGTMAYAVRGVNKGPKDTLSLGLLPIRNNGASRTANCVTKPDHVLWTMKDGEEVRSWFEKSFPRMPFQKASEGGIVSDGEWDRFAKSEGGRFPAPQRCEGMCEVSEDGTKGVALVGDAAHAFPPDIGQGVNSALGDVLALDAAIAEEAMAGSETAGAAPCLGRALEKYEQRRSPEISALVRLCASTNPLQYGQPGRMEKIRKKLWLVNFLVRTILNKASFGLVPNHAFLLIQNEKLSYPQITRRSDIVTASLTSALLLGLWKVMGRVLAATIV